MSMILDVSRPRHLPAVPAESPSLTGWVTGLRESVKVWWQTGSLRQPVPGMLRAGEGNPPAPMFVATSFGLRPDHNR
jgi:hypothetical protein